MGRAAEGLATPTCFKVYQITLIQIGARVPAATLPGLTPYKEHKAVPPGSGSSSMTPTENKQSKS